MLQVQCVRVVFDRLSLRCILCKVPVIYKAVQHSTDSLARITKTILRVATTITYFQILLYDRTVVPLNSESQLIKLNLFKSLAQQNDEIIELFIWLK